MRAAEVSRSFLYYRPKSEGAENLALMRRMDELHMEYPFYGSRQMMRHLRREDVVASRHRVRRLMELMGGGDELPASRTSATNPEHQISPYLLRALDILRADQVWCADITHVPVTHDFVYLVAVMDWATRHAPAWRLSRSLKYEAVYLHELRDGLDAERIVGTWVDFYKRRPPALVVRRADARRGLPRWSNNVVTTIRRGALYGAQPARPRLTAWRGRRAPVPSVFPSGAGPDGKTEAGLQTGVGRGASRTGRSGACRGTVSERKRRVACTRDRAR